MIFHTYGNPANKTMVLIHSMMQPWQVWEPAAEYFSKTYCVVIPELDGNTQDAPTEFISAEKEAEQIRDHLLENFGGRADVICGLALGGRIAAMLADMEELTAEYLILDGTWLIPQAGILRGLVKKLYYLMLNKTKERDPAALGDNRNNLSPERCFDSYLKVIDNMSESSLSNMLDSALCRFRIPVYDKELRIMVMHGTTKEEQASRKSAHKMKKKNPQARLRMFEGYNQCKLALYDEKRWIAEVSAFLNK